VIEEALRADRREFHGLFVREGALAREWTPVLDRARRRGLPIRELDSKGWERIELLLGDSPDQGCVLEAGPLPILGGVQALTEALPPSPQGHLVVAFDGVEDPQNVGSLARVADAAGVSGLLLTERRSPPMSPALSRASSGAVEWQRVARVTNLSRGLQGLKEAGFWVLAADPAAEKTVFELPDLHLGGNLVLVLGAEGKGLRPGVLAQVDHRARLPMLGRVDSLNVATAGAVLLYEVVRRRLAV
jgi:23S rRNA (guanosine2251-2'-O)-methyltransferase